MLITKFLFGILAIIVSKIIYKPIESIRDDFDINNVKSSFIQKALVDNNSPESVKSGETVDVITNKNDGEESDKTKQEASNAETKVESTTTKEQVHHHEQLKEQSEPPKNSEEGTKQPETAENPPKDNSHQHQTAHSQAGHHGHKGQHSHSHHHGHSHGHQDEEDEDEDFEDLHGHEEDEEFHHSGKGHNHTSDHKTKGDSTHRSLESSKVEQDKDTGKPENSPKLEDNQKTENEQKVENGPKGGETEKVESDQKTEEAKPANEPENKKEDVVEQQNNEEKAAENGPNKEETSPNQNAEQKTVVEEQTKVPEATNEEKEAKKSENENKVAEENGTAVQEQHETQEQTPKSESESSNDQTQQVSVETKGGELGESQDNSQPSCTCEKEVKPHEQPESSEQTDNSKEQNEGGTSVKAHLKAKSEAEELYKVNMGTLSTDQTQKVEEYYKKPEANCSIDCSKSCRTQFQGPTQCFTQDGKGVTCSAFADSTSLTCSLGSSPCSTPLVTSLNSYTMKNGSEEVGTLEVMGSNFNKCTGLSLAPADGKCTRENLLHNLLYTSGKLNLDYNMEVGPGKMVFSNLKIQNGDYKVCLFQRHDENGSPGPLASILYKLLTYVNPTHSLENGSKTLLSVEVGSLKVSD
ncbi:uncharacterized protein TA16375 [Theileria annulata]|uniref:Uncharacterized protein n=1 Tax=Theileria annulata TaxID=5874 RepID=Q4UIV3_THEAN|nr:uncharacterized protein TA16375 [Theileria annulata]CAI72986.1 hypothetical protein, conserved [Theileria annulata]|eukprot:XP_953664.1 hypothetical protein, conserved [Theileria annulata]